MAHAFPNYAAPEDGGPARFAGKIIREREVMREQVIRAVVDASKNGDADMKVKFHGMRSGC